MVDIETLRQLALAFPNAVDESKNGGFAFSIGGKGFAWSFLERAAPKKPRAPRQDILAVPLPGREKEDAGRRGAGLLLR